MKRCYTSNIESSARTPQRARRAARPGARITAGSKRISNLSILTGRRRLKRVVSLEPNHKRAARLIQAARLGAAMCHLFSIQSHRPSSHRPIQKESAMLCAWRLDEQKFHRYLSQIKMLRALLGGPAEMTGLGCSQGVRQRTRRKLHSHAFCMRGAFAFLFA